CSTVIGDRAFHASAGAVIELAGAFIKGFGECGMIAVGKHFPGHGSVVA
ncbi:MAG: beta-N-acetylhexosaminidase, partial [Burkholderiales bacterium]|nr:beta-N-acetylhexosaminidase [Burkholderiales bacterium]